MLIINNTFFGINKYDLKEKLNLKTEIKLPPKFDFSKPEQVLEALFYSAKTRDFSVLENLCDPQEKGDIISLCVCRLSGKYKSEYAQNQDCREMDKKTFISLYNNAKKPKVLSNDGLYATVEYEVGNLNPTIELVKRGKRWYLFTLTSPEP